ncbi:hypothetical protein [Modestobacter italicus]|uniref:hypothetical protein n=1 Tax=Modestobacter italicus (strain DSM 44449 / CECT 9708 / BC 501) TaxID=2732864 RepID=UPI001C93AF0C|nr:hypothetical protein [Modestobacter italicus]
MSDEQDVPAAGWVDRDRPRPGDGTTETTPTGAPTGTIPPGATPAPTGATAAGVVPDQRSAGEPAEGTAPLADGAPEASPGESTTREPGAGTPPVPGPDHPGTPYPTTPVNVGNRPRPRPRMPRPGDPLIRMGPWAPVAGAALGLLLGVIVVLFLAPAVDTFDQRLSLVFVVLGLSLLGAGGTLLADEVRLLRRGAQAAEVRASNVGVIAGLLNGLTPARLLITASAFVLLLSAYVTGGS